MNAAGDAARGGPPRPGSRVQAHADELRSLLCRDPERSRILAHVQTLKLPDCWIAAGFVRNAVWDYLHGYPPSGPNGDVDVIWFDPARAEPAVDTALEQTLRSLDPNVVWSVKNQGRMHARNNDAPYTSAGAAMRFWPETATAVAVRHSDRGAIEIAAPFGLDDLFDLIVRPTPRFTGSKLHLYLDRVHARQWRRTWPRLQVAHHPD